MTDPRLPNGWTLCAVCPVRDAAWFVEFFSEENGEPVDGPVFREKMLALREALRGRPDTAEGERP
jgi:hypothetical protein